VRNATGVAISLSRRRDGFDSHTHEVWVVLMELVLGSSPSVSTNMGIGIGPCRGSVTGSTPVQSIDFGSLACLVDCGKLLTYSSSVRFREGPL